MLPYSSNKPIYHYAPSVQQVRGIHTIFEAGGRYHLFYAFEGALAERQIAYASSSNMMQWKNSEDMPQIAVNKNPLLFPMGDDWIRLLPDEHQLRYQYGSHRAGKFQAEGEDMLIKGAYATPYTFIDTHSRRLLMGYLSEASAMSLPLVLHYENKQLTVRPAPSLLRQELNGEYWEFTDVRLETLQDIKEVALVDALKIHLNGSPDHLVYIDKQIVEYFSPTGYQVVYAPERGIRALRSLSDIQIEHLAVWRVDPLRLNPR